MTWPFLRGSWLLFLPAVLELQLVVIHGIPAEEVLENSCVADGDWCSLEAGVPVQATALLQAESRRKDGLQRGVSGGIHQKAKAAPAHNAIQAEEVQLRKSQEEDVMRQKISQLEARVAELEHQDANAGAAKKARHPVYAETCTTKAGDSCIFGLDDADEDSHCIPDTELEYGAFGWCYTKEDKSAWGTCGEMCPFFGQEKVLEEKLGLVQDRLYELLEEVNDMPKQCCGKNMPKEQGKTSPKHGGKGKESDNQAPESEPKGAPESEPKGPAETEKESENEKESAKELLLLMKSRHRAPRKA